MSLVKFLPFPQVLLLAIHCWLALATACLHNYVVEQEGIVICVPKHQGHMSRSPKNFLLTFPLATWQNEGPRFHKSINIPLELTKSSGTHLSEPYSPAQR